MYRNILNNKKLISIITIALCIFIGVGVYAGIQSEVGTYVWNPATSTWIKNTTSGQAVQGNNTPSYNYANPTNGINVVGLNMLWSNQDSKWSPLVSVNDVSGTADQGPSLQVSPVLWDGATSTWSVFSGRHTTDNIDPGGSGTIDVLATENLLYGYNTVTWDRLRTIGAGDNVTLGILATGLYGYDSAGGNWDRLHVDPSGSLYVNQGALTHTTDSVAIYHQKVSSNTTESSTANNCSNVSASLISTNANRVELITLNQSVTTAYICFAATCTTTTGMRLQENMGITDEHYTGVVSCITSSGSATIAVKEL
jgi:hypothetical protein